ncbi:hypothetical protein [uncultured Bacteroides sp.]|uniref:hypothetical protein n=1 Tax=uncultured Bacteroides sp. TaxID=162156 RepID=UPI0025DD8E34|nr:hypothetical protein [uncultured Bacteroides sp.]
MMGNICFPRYKLNCRFYSSSANAWQQPFMAVALQQINKTNQVMKLSAKFTFIIVFFSLYGYGQGYIRYEYISTSMLKSSFLMCQMPLL